MNWTGWQSFSVLSMWSKAKNNNSNCLIAMYAVTNICLVLYHSTKIDKIKLGLLKCCVYLYKVVLCEDKQHQLLTGKVHSYCRLNLYCSIMRIDVTVTGKFSSDCCLLLQYRLDANSSNCSLYQATSYCWLPWNCSVGSSPMLKSNCRKPLQDVII